MKLTSIREKIEKQYYDGDFPNLDLIELAFDFPKEMLDAYRKRNPSKELIFYAYPLKEEHPSNSQKLYPYIGLYDPKVMNTLIKGDISRSLSRNTAYILKLNENKRFEIPEEFQRLLNINNYITVVGNDEMIELWKPETYEEFDSTKARGVDFDLDDEDLTGLRRKAWSQS